MSDIFLSYSGEDRQRAEVFARHFESRGWTIWWDKRIPVGKKFDHAITEELNAARCVVVLWSAWSVFSDWVKDEASEGAKRGILIPILIDDVEIPLGFRRIQTAKLIKWTGQLENAEFKWLLESVRSLLDQQTFDPTEITRGNSVSASLFRMNFNTGITHQKEIDQTRPETIVNPDPDYEDLRRAKFHDLVKKSQIPVKTRRFLQRLIIGKSGDVEIREQYELTQALANPVSEIVIANYSKTAFFKDPTVESMPGQQIEFQWDYPSETQGSKKGTIRFDPPIDQDPISFSVSKIIFNAFLFNQQDKLDASNGMYRDEFIELKVTHAFDVFVYSVSFPQKHFPAKFRPEVFDEQNVRDFDEEKYFISRLSNMTDISTISFTIDRPLPGYTYKISWDLPTESEENLRLAAPDKVFKEEIVSRLLQLRLPGNPYSVNVRYALDQLKEEIKRSIVFADLGGDWELEFFLHAYSNKDWRLACVADVSDSNPSLTIWDRFIRVGETSIGMAYKRREMILWTAKPDQEIEDAELMDFGENHTAILSIPLSYPIAAGATVAIFSLASKSPTSILIGLNTNTTSLYALMEHITVVFTKTLLTALMLTPPPLLRQN